MTKDELLECLRAQCMYPDGYTRRPARVKYGSCQRCGAIYLRARASTPTQGEG